MLFLFVFQLLSVTLFSQQKREERDSLVRLIEARSAQIQEIDGISFRKVVGNARFFHNNTYLLCDTALWNVNENVIKAIGNVQVIQENTFLVSDKIDYVVDENMAKVRGNLVELYDKDGNVLRTNFLDYNTRDSIGNFFNGGVMKGASGNIIESREGWYFAYDKLFSFEENVQMFTDSIFVKADKLEYSTAENKAYFGRNTTAWQEDNMLFANDGEYDRGANVFRFYKDGYILTKDQELWADTLSYFRNTGVAELENNIQILDTKQSAYSFADHALYQPNPFCITLTEKPAVALYTVENGVRDTMFLAADTLKYYHVRYCDVDSAAIEQAKTRIELSNLDPLTEIEAESAKKRVDNTTISNFITPKRVQKEEQPPQSESDSLQIQESDKPSLVQDSLQAARDMSISLQDSLAIGGDSLFANSDSLAVMQDSLFVDSDSVAVISDSLSLMSDSLTAVRDSIVVEPQDTTAVTFIDAWNNVKVYRNDLQALCDSLVYTDLDSMARLYINPVMWNEVKHQFTSDSMQLVIKDGALSKANLISNAFIASQEDTIHYNQIKGTEMVAYFRDNDLYRYDALGGSSMIFYLQEDGVITMMNQKEGKIISARIKDREIQRIKYIESLKNDAYPVYNLPVDQQRLKGFNWRGEERPKSRFELVDRKIKDSKRDKFKRKRFPNYPYSAIYFPEERDGIMDFKRLSDSIRTAREMAKLLAEKEQERDTSDMGIPVLEDSLDVKPIKDSLATSEKVEVEKEMAVGKELSQEEKAFDATKETAVSRKEARMKRKLEKEEQKRLKREQKKLRKEEKRLKKEQRKLEKTKKRMERKAKIRGESVE